MSLLDSKRNINLKKSQSFMLIFNGIQKWVTKNQNLKIGALSVNPNYSHYLDFE